LDEVTLAVKKGYRIFDIYEVYEYQVTQYKRETGEGGVFVVYINTFLKIKAEASGYPSWVRSPEDEERFIDSFEQSEGIRLDRESIKFNAANAVWPNCVSTPRGENRRRGMIVQRPK